MSNNSNLLTRACTDHPRSVTVGLFGFTAALVILALLPSLWPDRFPALNGIHVDTDPENMLSHDEAVRVFHNRMKDLLALHDLIVVGVVNENDPDGVFNPQSLRAVYNLTEFARTLRGAALGLKDPRAGVIEVDLLAPSTVDNIEQGGPGTVRFEWLMPAPPSTPEEARAIRQKAERIPFLRGSLISEDGQALCLYLPITSKDVSYRVYSKLREFIRSVEGDEKYYITGLPVAEDTFGVEMFIQMAISAPLAMLVIFLLMFYFFRKLVLIAAPMILALVTVLCTMALLVVTGNTIHIMSSMIPIFIMPISILDSIHILSEFFERYQQFRDRRKTIQHVMATLHAPMLYTSLTSAAGFGSLALTPIPPVIVFGVFVCIGVMLAWVFTVSFIPAYVMLMPERWLANFGAHHSEDEDEKARRTFLGRLLLWTGEWTYDRARFVLVGTLVVAALAAYGITRIQINDNPVKWFRTSHPIRVADSVLNEHFGGTYMAYLALWPRGEEPPSADTGRFTESAPRPRQPAVEPTGAPDLPGGLGEPPSAPALPAGLESTNAPELPPGLGEATPPAPSAIEPPASAAAPEAVQPEIFKEPEALRYVAALQEHLLTTGVVGKSNSLADIVKTVHRELIDGTEAQFRIPDSPQGVAQCLMQYQSSHRPHDLWHFVTPDYRTTSIWVQLRSGDNKDMERVVAAVNAYAAQNPPPFNLQYDWFGLTYINVIWQEKMVWGMLQSFLGSFLVVMLMMLILFRSGLWGALSMIPLTVTIGLIYGLIGLIGKDYDMPVAVLSSLTLGLAVDFAIHFLTRARQMHDQRPSWKTIHGAMFGEPARAIVRNILAVAIGFLPLLAAPLVPYNTVGIFMALILFASGIGTMIIMPALITVLEPVLFPATSAVAFTCRCGTCVVAALLAAGTVALNLQQFFALSWGVTLAWSAPPAAVMAALCWILSRREQCRTPAAST